MTSNNETAPRGQRPNDRVNGPASGRAQIRVQRGPSGRAAEHKAARPKTNEGERLSKRVAELVPCSRREAEQYIEGGWVMVDGQVVEEPMFRVSSQAVAMDPHASLLELAAVTLLLHKPPGYDAMAMPGEANPRVKPAQQLLKPNTRAAEDASGTRMLKHHFAKLTATVPLETAASGLIVFTQDWRVARKLAEDASVMEQEMLVEVAGTVPPQTLQRLNQGLNSDGQPLPAVKVSVNSASDTSAKLRFALKGAHPGLIAYLCERVGLQIVSMKRMRVGRVSLSGLAVGQWRYLTAHERF
jgi:23S rRNA pseudouridine2604 synthase